MAKATINTIADHPKVAAERAKHVELQTKLAEAKAQVEKSTDKAGPTPFDLKVSKAMGRETEATPVATLDQSAALEDYRVLAVALDRQRAILTAAENDAAVEVAKAARPEYQSLLRKLKAALLPLRDAMNAERAFREQAFVDGVSLSALGTAPLRGISDMAVEGWLAEIASKHKI